MDNYKNHKIFSYFILAAAVSFFTFITPGISPISKVILFASGGGICLFIFILIYGSIQYVEGLQNGITLCNLALTKIQEDLSDEERELMDGLIESVDKVKEKYSPKDYER